MDKNISFDDVKPGDILPHFETIITRTDIVKYAGAGGDFNPLHHDDKIAKSVGLPSVFAMGLLHGGYLARVLTDWAGPQFVRRYKIRFMSQVWPDDKIICEGVVAGKSTENGQNIIHCMLSVKKEDGTSVIEGDADIMLLPNDISLEK